MWQALTQIEQINTLKETSFNKPVAIFKHSTRCSISTVALSRLERAGLNNNIDWYFLDLLQFREISNVLATTFNVYHESPQILLIKNGECIYDQSHNGIVMAEILEQFEIA